MRKIFINKKGEGAVIQGAISIVAIIVALSLVFMTVSQPYSQSPVAEKLSMREKADKLAALLMQPGETKTGELSWQTQVATIDNVKDIGLGVDPDYELHITSCDEQTNVFNSTKPIGPDTPPNKPSVSGAQEVYLGDSEYYTATGTDNDSGDKLQFQFDFGNGMWSGWTPTSYVPSGGSTNQLKTWSVVGTYYVEVRSRDLNGSVSVESNGLKVVVSGGGGDDDIYVDDDTCCFPAGTLVTLADGSMKPIEFINVGDQVLSYDLEHNGFVSDRVVSLIVKIREGVYSINNGLLCPTDDHPLYVRKCDGRLGWASVNPEKSKEMYSNREALLPLGVGDELFTGEGWIKINSLVYKPGASTVYTFAVDQYHQYFANGVLVSNAKAKMCNLHTINITTNACLPCGTQPCSGWGPVVQGYYTNTGVWPDCDCTYPCSPPHDLIPSVDDPLTLVHQQNCFLSGTKILMADKSVKNIEDIQAGDKILSYDVENGQFSTDEIVEVYHDLPSQMQDDYHLVINDELRVTADHLLYIDGQWIPAGNLNVGDQFSNLKKVSSIEYIMTRDMTYNLHTKQYHNFVVDLGDGEYVIAHNDEKNYVIGGYNEKETGNISQSTAIENLFKTGALELGKVNALKHVSKEVFTEKFNLGTLNADIKITSYDGAEPVLDYQTGYSPYDAKVVATNEQVRILVDENTGQYSIVNMIVSVYE